MTFSKQFINVLVYALWMPMDGLLCEGYHILDLVRNPDVYRRRMKPSHNKELHLYMFFP